MTEPVQVPRSRDPQRLPQDVSIWPESAADLALAVADRDLWLLRSPDPAVRAVLAADDTCSEAAMCLLVGDVEAVRVELAGNRKLSRRAGDMLLVTAIAADEEESRGSPTLDVLVANPEARLGPTASQRQRQTYIQLLQRLLRDPGCEVELLRVMWQIPEVQGDVAGHPSLPDDLVLRAATIPPEDGGQAIRAEIRERGWDAAALEWGQVRDYAVGLAPDAVEQLFSVLPARFIAAAVGDEDARMRGAVAATTEAAELLGGLARDPEEAVRRRASGRLLQLLVGPPV